MFFFFFYKTCRNIGTFTLGEQTKIRTLEATVMTVVKNEFEAWGLRKTDEDLLDVF